MSNLSTKPYKGVRDFYPEDWMLQKWMFWKMKDVAESFGYENYNASPLEASELYEAKSGEEIVTNETYNLVDRGDRRVTIRPEMTPTVARMVADRGRDLPKPIRWYSIPNLFRYERPQRGRLREHYQLNVDIFGTESIQADAEVIELGYKIMKSFGADDEDFTIFLNNRKIVNSELSLFCFFDNQKVYKLSKLIDKKKKISEEQYITSSREILSHLSEHNFNEVFLRLYPFVEKTSDTKEVLSQYQSEEFISNLMNALKEVFSDIQKNQENIESEQFELIELRYRKGISEIVDLLLLLTKSIPNAQVRYANTLMRGFDYYTGTIFEFFDTHPDNNRSLFGGGRYDDLLDIFDKEKMPAVGFGMGDVTARDFLETHGLLPDLTSHTHITIAAQDNESLTAATSIVTALRTEGINVEFDFTLRKAAKMIEAVDKKHIPFFVMVGENEIDSGMYEVKNLITGEKQSFDQSGIIDLLKNQ